MSTYGPEDPQIREHISKDTLITLLRQLKPHEDRPAFVAISGYGGSGKSTFAQGVSKAIGSDTAVIPIDDFIIGARDERSVDWRTFDRSRLHDDIIEPASVGKTLRYQRYNSGDWVANRGGDWIEVTVGKVVIVEGCGILHPTLLPHYDFSAWIDLPQPRALESAKYRDASEIELFGDDDTAALWDNVWGPNDKDFFETFRPDLNATVLVEPQF